MITSGKKEDGNRVPNQDHGYKQAGGDIVRGQVDDQKLNREQERNNDDTGFHKPCQPCPLVEPGIAHLRLFLCPFDMPPPETRVRQFRCLYPESFAIIENSGMYSEMTIPPTTMPRAAIMAGSSKVSMFLMAASTSSS